MTRALKPIAAAVIISVLAIVTACTGNVERQETVEDAFLWDGNTIYGLTDKGKSMEYLSIPQKCVSIAPETFKSNTGLEEIYIPDTVQYIGNGAFEGCSQLAAVMLPKGLNSIENNTFKDCAALETIDIPNSVKEIGINAFDDCSSLVITTANSKK